MAKNNKMKSHRGLAKRIKITGTGKVKHWRANTGHLVHGKSTKRMRHLRKSALIHPSDYSRIKDLIRK